MFSLRPSRAWQNSGDSSKTKILTGGPRATFGGFFSFLFKSQGRAQPLIRGRRAQDALGRTVQATPLSWKSILLGTREPRIEIAAGEWMSAQEHAQMLELHDGADLMVNELAQTDLQLASLQAQMAGASMVGDLQQTTDRTFAKIDTDLQRWNIRAEEIERMNDGSRMVAFNPTTGSLFAGPMSYVRQLWNRALSGHSLQPQRFTPANARENRRTNIKQEQMRMNAPALKLRDQQAQMKANQAKTVENLRLQMNALAAPRTGINQLRMVRLARLHDQVEHLASDLQHHRHEADNKAKVRLDRRRTARQPLPAPVLKPKRTDEKV